MPIREIVVETVKALMKYIVVPAILFTAPVLILGWWGMFWGAFFVSLYAMAIDD